MKCNQTDCDSPPVFRFTEPPAFVQIALGGKGTTP